MSSWYATDNRGEDIIMNNHIYRHIAGILWCSLLCHGSIICMSIEKITDTYQPMLAPYKHLSIAHGATLAESHILRNYYDFGAMEEGSKEKWLAPGDGPIRLIHALWTLINKNFLPSSNPSYPAAHIRATTIARILLFLERVRLKTQKPEAKELETLIVEDPSFKKSVLTADDKKKEINDHFKKEITDTAALLKDAKPEQRTSIEGHIDQLKKECSHQLSRHDTGRLFKTLRQTRTQQTIEQELKDLEQLKGEAQRKQKRRIRQLKCRLQSLSKAPTTGDCNRVLELAQAILDANDYSAYYPSTIAYAILQAFLYKTAKKHDIWAYNHTLQDELGPQIFIDPAYIDGPSWLSSHFDQKIFPEIQQELLNLYKENPQQFLSLVRDNLYEQFLYAQVMEHFYRGTIPKKPEYANVSYKGFTYPDCSETTMRFLCNIQFYDPETGSFQLSPEYSNQLDPLLRSFYQHHVNKQGTAVDMPEVHQNWANILVNRPFVTYRSMLYPSQTGSPLIISPPKGVDGFIRLPKDIATHCQRDKENPKRIIIGTHYYILVERDDVELFKVAPTLKNIIVTFNQLLGLKLYDQQAFLNSDFNAIYFPKISSCLKALEMLSLDKHEIDQLDKLDYSHQGLHLAGETAELELLTNHAEFTAYEKKSENQGYAPMLIDAGTQETSPEKYAQLMHLCSVSGLAPEQIPPSLCHHLLCACNLQDHREKINVLKNYLQTKYLSGLPPEPQERLVSAAAKIMAALPIRLDWVYQQQCVSAVDTALLSHPSISPIIQRWKKIGYQRLYDEILEPDSVPDFFAALVRRGVDYQDGIKMARESMHKAAPIISHPETRWLVKESSLKLYYALAKKGQAQQEALDATELLPDAPITKDIYDLFG